MRLIRIAAMLAVGALFAVELGLSATTPGMPEWRPPARGVVPDENTAVAIATAILSAYSPTDRRELEKYRPWHAVAVGDTWEVRGTLPFHAAGGTQVVTIAKLDGRVISIWHEE